MKDTLIIILITISSLICACCTVFSKTMDAMTANLIIGITIQPLIICTFIELTGYLLYRYKIMKTKYEFANMSQFDREQLTRELRDYLQ